MSSAPDLSLQSTPSRPVPCDPSCHSPPLGFTPLDIFSSQALPTVPHKCNAAAFQLFLRKTAALERRLPTYLAPKISSCPMPVLTRALFLPCRSSFWLTNPLMICRVFSPCSLIVRANIYLSSYPSLVIPGAKGCRLLRASPKG